VRLCGSLERSLVTSTLIEALRGRKISRAWLSPEQINNSAILEENM